MKPNKNAETPLKAEPARTIALYIGDDHLERLDNSITEENTKKVLNQKITTPKPLNKKEFFILRRDIRTKLEAHEINITEANKIIKKAMHPKPVVEKIKRASRRTIIEAALDMYLPTISK